LRKRPPPRQNGAFRRRYASFYRFEKKKKYEFVSPAYRSSNFFDQHFEIFEKSMLLGLKQSNMRP